jgi:hypothetical protein
MLIDGFQKMFEPLQSPIRETLLALDGIYKLRQQIC